MFRPLHIEAFCKALAEKSKADDRMDDASEIIMHLAADMGARRGYEFGSIFYGAWIKQGHPEALSSIVRVAKDHRPCSLDDCNVCSMMRHARESLLGDTTGGEHHPYWKKAHARANRGKEKGKEKRQSNWKQFNA